MKPEAILVPLAVAVLAGLSGWAVGRLGRRGWGAAAVAAAWLFAIVVWAQGRAATGWDGLGYAIVLVAIALPLALGLTLGVGLGLWRARRVAARRDPG